MEYDRDKVDEATLGLLYLVMWDDKVCNRAWKSFDWATMNRLHEKGWIHDPKSKAKSVAVTDEGAEKAKELFEKLFGRAE